MVISSPTGNNLLPARKKRSKLRTFLYSLVFLILCLLIIFFALEAFIRIFYPQEEVFKFFLEDRKYGFVMKTDYTQHYKYLKGGFVMNVVTNSYGHRYPEYDKRKLSSPAFVKVLFIGDSFTFGQGLELKDTFVYLSDSLLNQGSPRKPFTIINSGVGGWGTLQETTYAKDHFTLFNPDIIVLTFCENDPNDDLKFKTGMHNKDRGVLNFPGKMFFKYHSQLYQFIYHKFSEMMYTKMIQKRLAGKKIRYEGDPQGTVSEKDWDTTLRTISKFYQDFRRFNNRGILLIQATTPWVPDIRNHLKQLSNDSTIYYVDLYEETVSIPDSVRMLPYDRQHWSGVIHRISAEKISETINACYQKMN